MVATPAGGGLHVLTRALTDVPNMPEAGFPEPEFKTSGWVAVIGRAAGSHRRGQQTSGWIWVKPVPLFSGGFAVGMGRNLQAARLGVFQFLQHHT
ncbi:hypothetical protein FHW64_002736 [Variovorax sp. Sphag1AA]|nr:hypothetical protein [Variovorax sp. Sphag1AA]